MSKKRKRQECDHEGCETIPCYGIEWKKARFCQNHAEPGMEDVKSKRCDHEGCETRPSYGTEWKKARFCQNHAEPGMEDVKSKRCEHEGCKTMPSYGTEWKKARFCQEHAEPGMEDVKSKRCEHEGCKSQPSYGTEWKKARFCQEHAEPGMEDVKSKRCEHEGCKSQPSYGDPGHATTKCADHRIEGMIRLSNRRCRIRGCREIAVFGTLTSQLHCEDHAVEGEVNLIERKCKDCGLLNILSPVSLKCGYCDTSFKKKRPVKWKELDIKGCLEAAGYALIHDKAIGKECKVMDRPDFVIDGGDKLVIVEADEHQHTDRMCSVTCECPVNAPKDCKCQQGRMVDIGQTCGGVPQVWFRFNTDKYTMCDGPGKVGMAKRKQELLKWVKWALEREVMPGYTTVIYLYYDGNDTTERVLF